MRAGRGRQHRSAMTPREWRAPTAHLPQRSDLLDRRRREPQPRSARSSYGQKPARTQHQAAMQSTMNRIRTRPSHAPVYARRLQAISAGAGRYAVIRRSTRVICRQDTQRRTRRPTTRATTSAAGGNWRGRDRKRQAASAQECAPNITAADWRELIADHRSSPRHRGPGRCRARGTAIRRWPVSMRSRRKAFHPPRDRNGCAAAPAGRRRVCALRSIGRIGQPPWERTADLALTGWQPRLTPTVVPGSPRGERG